ncbi:AsmA family protein [Microbulbifer yueqingensis]|uniref:Uncharacterized protein involved in outer membrane biogenesis n=1 Tax=Microbulbifer yueqingensis TaxID=658219 RepID=A0A1G9DG79_9GAMM|nr:AsmA family protein [Microbulbifer yueqingensis]SDK62869.1 Uncharacterized protein involved in outer membrane biogenesis [Microbulbifer yueqingensis]
MAWIKNTLIALLIIILLLAGAAAWLLTGIDINRYKPQLEQAAAKQGIALKLDGDIGWQLWPSLALELEGVQLAPLPAPDQPLVQADKIAVGVAVMPLLKKRVEAEEIVLLGPRIDLTVDESGKGNWELLTDAMEAQRKADAKEPPQLKVEEEKEPGAEELKIALEKLRIEDGVVNYSDAKAGTQYTLEKLHVSADNLVPGGDVGQLEASAEVAGSSLKQPVELKMDSSLALDEGLNGLRLQPFELRAKSGEAAARLYLRGHVRRTAPDQPWQLQLSMNAEANPLRPWLDVTGTELVTQSGSALRKFSMETNIEGTEKKISLTPLQLQLDDTAFAGSAQFRNEDIPGIDLTLRGGALVLDDYLPPPAPQEEEQQPEQEAPPAEPVELPLTAMRGFNANIELALERLNALELQLDAPLLRLNIDNGLYQLQELSADIYDGEFSSNGQFNARGQVATANMTGGLVGVEISKVQQVLFPSDRVQVSGKSTVNWAAQTKGKTDQALQKNLRAAVQVSSQQLALAPFNLEKGMCQLVSFVEKTPLPDQDWPAQTRLQDLRVNIKVEGDQVKVQEILAGVENIALTGDGEVNMEKADFDFALGLSLTGERTSDSGCSVQNDRWRNRPLPLRCKGEFETAGIGSCKPDTRRTDDLLREELKYKAEKKYGEKVEKKVDELKEKFKGLFKRD